MLADNLRNSSLSEAVLKTFDGNHPCKLCVEISTGKKSERKSEFQFALKKLEFTHGVAVVHVFPPQGFRLTGDPHDFLTSLNQVPPLPPPRFRLPG